MMGSKPAPHEVATGSLTGGGGGALEDEIMVLLFEQRFLEPVFYEFERGLRIIATPCIVLVFVIATSCHVATGMNFNILGLVLE